jgi:hypothetical protein
MLPSTMRAGEWFTGDVVDATSGAGLTFYFVSHKDTTSRLTLEEVSADLELRDFATVGPGRDVSTLDAVVQVLLGNAPEDETWPLNRPVPDEIRVFADYLLSEPVVPVRTNPLSLANLAAIVSGAGVGAGIGFAMGGPTPLLIITIPAGIVIGAAATGAGYGLRDGLHWKIRKWMGVPPDWKP